jgi:hypothetical protein
MGGGTHVIRYLSGDVQGGDVKVVAAGVDKLGGSVLDRENKGGRTVVSYSVSITADPHTF